jgi:hypothetical protein
LGKITIDKGDMGELGLLDLLSTEILTGPVTLPGGEGVLYNKKQQKHVYFTVKRFDLDVGAWGF